MKIKLLLFLAFLFFQNIHTQAQKNEILPRGFSKKELLEMADNQFRKPNGTLFSDPPPGEVRTMAEWEELEALIITWSTGSNGIKNILVEIVRHAKEEVQCEQLVCIFLTACWCGTGAMLRIHNMVVDDCRKTAQSPDTHPSCSAPASAC